MAIKKFPAIMHAEHVVVKRMIQEISAVGPFSPDGREKLALLEELLLNHLEREETYFYPLLYDAACHLPRAAKAMENLRDRTVSLSMDFLLFFQQLNSQESQDELLVRYEIMIAKLLQRMQDEESHLMALYQELPPLSP